MWEGHKELKILLREKSRGVGNKEMLVINRCRIFYLRVFYSELKYTEL
jgi:hypothetical protein